MIYALQHFYYLFFLYINYNDVRFIIWDLWKFYETITWVSVEATKMRLVSGGNQRFDSSLEFRSNIMEINLG